MIILILITEGENAEMQFHLPVENNILPKLE